MTIDAHQHFIFPSRVHYPWLEGAAMRPLRRDFGPEDLRPLLLENGVDKTVLVQTRSSPLETAEFLRIAAETDYVAGVVGWVDLTDPAVGEGLRHLLAPPYGKYLKGIRHQVHDEPDPWWLLQDRVQQGIAELGKQGLAYDFLTRGRELPACLETARNHPGVRFVTDHIAKPDIAAGEWESWRRGLSPLSELPNVWVKLSGMVTEARWEGWTVQQIEPYVREVLALFGPKRLLFGSDWPVCLLAAGYGRVRAALEVMLGGLGPADRSAIFGDNARQVYQI